MNRKTSKEVDDSQLQSYQSIEENEYSTFIDPQSDIEMISTPSVVNNEIKHNSEFFVLHEQPGASSFCCRCSVLIIAILALPSLCQWSFVLVSSPSPSPTPLSPVGEANAFRRFVQPINVSCLPGIHRDVSQLPFTAWQAHITAETVHRLYPTSPSGGTGYNVQLPVYSTVDLDEANQLDIQTIVIVQHGNLRNANDYFCSAITSLQQAASASNNLSSYAIIAPLFLVDGDLCWLPDTAQLQTVYAAKDITCGHRVWSSEGWKDGHLSLNNREAGQGLEDDDEDDSSRFDRVNLYAYTVFDLLLARLLDKRFFPKLRSLALFGFSAGGQTVLRYAHYPHYTDYREEVEGKVEEEEQEVDLKYVVADISSYLYLDKQRPVPRHLLLSDTTSSSPTTPSTPPTPPSPPQHRFAVPSGEDSWLSAAWRYDHQTNRPWLTSWANASCSAYNDWRYGLELLTGYYRHHAHRLVAAEGQGDIVEEATYKALQQLLLASYPHRNLHFLVGLNDSANCHLQPAGDDSSSSSSSSSSHCEDHELATGCAAMLQGENRLDRFEQYKAYLELLLSTAEGQQGQKDKEPAMVIHKVQYVRDVSHDPVAMLMSEEAQCLLFDLCRQGQVERDQTFVDSHELGIV